MLRERCGEGQEGKTVPGAGYNADDAAWRAGICRLSGPSALAVSLEPLVPTVSAVRPNGRGFGTVRHVSHLSCVLPALTTSTSLSTMALLCGGARAAPPAISHAEAAKKLPIVLQSRPGGDASGAQCVGSVVVSVVE